MIRFTRALAMAAMLSAAPAAASAITQSVTLTGQTSHFEPFGGTFQKFNPALGTLQTVTLQISGDITYFISFSPCADSCSANFGFSTGYWFNAPGFPPATPDYGPDFFALINWFATAATPDLDPQSNGPNPIDFLGSPSGLADYVGPGTIDVVGGISEDSDFCDGDGVDCDQSDFLALTTTLTYVYASVPEPAAAALFVPGLLGLGFVVRRRVSRKASA